MVGELLHETVPQLFITKQKKDIQPIWFTLGSADNPISPFAPVRCQSTYWSFGHLLALLGYLESPINVLARLWHERKPESQGKPTWTHGVFTDSISSTQGQVWNWGPLRYKAAARSAYHCTFTRQKTRGRKWLLDFVMKHSDILCNWGMLCKVAELLICCSKCLAFTFILSLIWNYLV